MAGVRNEPLSSGKYRGWFTDMNGKQKAFTGTKKKAETLRMAQRLEDEHRQIRLGYRPVPVSADKHRTRPFSEVKDEYIAWGETQGGRGGRPWSKGHARMRRTHLIWWQEQLGLDTLADLDGILPRAEEALRKLQAKERAGKTLANYTDALQHLCNWCVTRGYLDSDPLKGLAPFDITPNMTMNLYAKARPERLAQAVEAVGEIINARQQHAHSMHKQAAGAEGVDITALPQGGLCQRGSGGGGGIRTRRPCPTHQYAIRLGQAEVHRLSQLLLSPRPLPPAFAPGALVRGVRDLWPYSRVVTW